MEIWRVGIYIGVSALIHHALCSTDKPNQCPRWIDLCQRKCEDIDTNQLVSLECERCVIRRPLALVCEFIEKADKRCDQLAQLFTVSDCGRSINVDCRNNAVDEELFDCDSGEELPNPPPPSPNPQTGEDKDQTTVIVIAVCVSVVVVLIAVLITAVYCWRVRRRSAAKRRSEGVGRGNNAFTNESYRRGHEIGRDRPESTYNTINDSQLDHEYHTLESATKSTLDSQNIEKENEYNITNEYRVPEQNDRDKMNKATYNGIKHTDEYNKIKFNKSVMRSNDQSYSHLNSAGNDSDYNSTSDKASTTTSAYQYGVPTKIVGIDKLQAEHVAYVTKAEHDKSIINDANEHSNEPETSNDNYAIASKTNKEPKPKAVVTPIQKDGGLALPTRAIGSDCSKQADSDSESEYESDIGNVTRGQNDDYEITEGIISEDNSKSQQSVVHIAERPKNVTDDYEIAAIQNDNNYDKQRMNVKERNVAGSEIDKKTFRIVEQKTDKEVKGNDGYELTEL